MRGDVTEPAFAPSGYAHFGGVVDFTATVNPVLKPTSDPKAYGADKT